MGWEKTREKSGGRKENQGRGRRQTMNFAKGEREEQLKLKGAQPRNKTRLTKQENRTRPTLYHDVVGRLLITGLKGAVGGFRGNKKCEEIFPRHR